MLPLLRARVALTPDGDVVPLIDTIGKMGARARDALPTLERVMRVGTLQAALHAYVARGRIMGVAEPTFEELKKQLVLDWKAADGGYAVLSCLEKHVKNASFAVPDLLAALRSQGTPKYVQAKIIEIIGQVEPATPQIVAALFDCLAERFEDGFYQTLASGGLWRQVQAGRKALVPATAEGLHHRSGRVKMQAATLLLHGPISSKALPAIIDCLEDTAGQAKLHWGLVYTLLADLRRLKDDGARAADVMVKYLPDEFLSRHGIDAAQRSRTRTLIFLALADVGGSPRAMPFIQEALQVRPQGRLDGDLAYYAAAARAAGALGPAGKAAVPGLLRSLKDDFHDDVLTPDGLQSSFYVMPRKPSSARVEAIIALGRIGPDALRGAAAAAQARSGQGTAGVGPALGSGEGQGDQGH